MFLAIHMLGDRRLLEHAVLNLLVKASKCGPRNDSIGVFVSQEDDWARVRVTDHGAGITTEDQDRVFDGYMLGTTASSLEVDGLGLGLALVKALVGWDGGAVSVDSEPAKEASFWFTLRSANGEEQERRP